MIRLFLFALLFTATPAFANNACDTSYGNVHQVNPTIWRSARPSYDLLKNLMGQGLTTVIDLEDDAPTVANEAAMAKGLGLDFISIPLHTFKPVKDEKMNRILSILTDPNRKGSVLVHCMGGQDRTGLVIGLYRVLNEQWAEPQAYQEMLCYGFHPEYEDLAGYFRNRLDLKQL